MIPGALPRRLPAGPRSPAVRGGGLLPFPARSAALVLLALLHLGCFEQPVTESMEIRFLPGNAVMLRVTVLVADPETFKTSAPARKRVEEARRELVAGTDPWTKRLSSLELLSQRTVLDRTGGEIRRVEQRVVAEHPEVLSRFFSDTLIRASVSAREKDAELTLVPEAGSRATRAQQDLLRQGMEKWSAAVSGYLEAGRSLYDYLEAHPGRARACFGNLFEDLLSQEAQAGREPTSEEDAGVLEPAKERMGNVLSLFDLPEDSAASLEEISRLAWDPFPAPLEVRVPGPILEQEGFEPAGPGLLRAAGQSLWSVLSRQRDRWLAPDPVFIYYEQMREGKQPLDLEEFLKRPRSAAPAPSAAEVLRILQEHSRPAPIYRVRWSTENLPQPEVRGEIWDSPALR
jgi:hypothetical protein